MPRIGTLAVNVTATTGGLQAGMARAKGIVGGFARSLLGGLGGVTGLGTLLTGAGIAAGMHKVVSLANTQLKAEQKLAAVLAATGNAAELSASQIKHFAAERQKLTNFGDDATINMAALLATFREIKGPVFKDAIVAVQDMATVMDTDLRSAAIQVGKALNDPLKGVAALGRVGVSFSQGQIGQIKSLQAGGNLAGAQQIILKELQHEFGGAAQAMADPLVQMKNAFGDLGESIGMDMLPAIRVFSRSAAEGAASITDATGSMSGQVSDLGQVLGYLGDFLQVFAGAISGAQVLIVGSMYALAKGFEGLTSLLADVGIVSQDLPDDVRSTADSFWQKMLAEAQETLKRAGQPWYHKQVEDEARRMAAGLRSGRGAGIYTGQEAPGTLKEAFAQIAARGSQEAYQAQIRHQYGDPKQDLIRQQLIEAQRANDHLGAIERKIDNVGVEVLGI